MSPHIGTWARGSRTHSKPLCMLSTKKSALLVCSCSSGLSCSTWEICCWAVRNSIIPDMVPFISVPPRILPSAFLPSVDLCCVEGRPYNARTQWEIAYAMHFEGENIIFYLQVPTNEYTSIWDSLALWVFFVTFKWSFYLLSIYCSSYLSSYHIYLNSE